MGRMFDSEAIVDGSEVGSVVKPAQLPPKRSANYEYPGEQAVQHDARGDVTISNPIQR